MNEHDVIHFMGRFPDAIKPANQSMMKTGVWYCSKCGNVKPPNSNPCKCGSIFWQTKKREAGA